MTDPARLDRHRRLWEADHRHLWHPFTQMQGWLDDETERMLVAEYYQRVFGTELPESVVGKG